MSESVKSAVRTLRILELFDAAEKPLGLKQITSQLNLPKSSAFMLVNTLLNEGYLEESEKNTFKLTAVLKENSRWIGGISRTISRAAASEMDVLLDIFEESVVLGCPTPALDIQIISDRQCKKEMGYRAAQQPFLPAWCSAMGHAILAFLPEQRVIDYLDSFERKPITSKTTTEKTEIMKRLETCRRRGYALNIDERIDGASGIAVPIRDTEGNPHAAINIVMLTPQFWHQKQHIIAELQHSAKRIERQLFLPVEQLRQGQTIAVRRAL